MGEPHRIGENEGLAAARGQGAAASLSQAEAATTTKTSAAHAALYAERLLSSREIPVTLTGPSPRHGVEERQ